MTDQIRLAYLDSVFFISVITPVYHRLPALIPLLKLIDEGKLQTVTSTMTLAEVRRFKSDSLSVGYVDEQQGLRVREMFATGRVLVVPLTEYIANRAAEIGNDYPDLLPADCVHIATAEFQKVDVLFTYDGEGKGRRRPGKMLAHDGTIGPAMLRISEPFVPLGPMFDLAALDRSPRTPPQFGPDELALRQGS